MFQKLLDDDKIEKAPILEVIKKQPREIMLSALLRMSEQAPFYIFTAFVFAYAVGTLKMSRELHPDRGDGGGLRVVRHHPAVRPHLRPHRPAEDVPDRRGGDRACSAFSISAWSIRAIPSAVFIAIVLSLIPHDMQYGPQAALIAEVVHAAAALQRRLARLSAGVDHRRRPGAAHRYRAVRRLSHRLCDAIYIAACAVISLVAASFMPDYTGRIFPPNMMPDARQRAWFSVT